MSFFTHTHRQDTDDLMPFESNKHAGFVFFFTFYLYKKPLDRDLHLMFSSVTTADVKARSKTSCHLKRLNSDRGLTHLPPSCAREAAAASIRTVLNLNQQMCAIRDRLCGNAAKWAPLRLETPSNSQSSFSPTQTFTGPQRKGGENQNRTPAPLVWGQGVNESSKWSADYEKLTFGESYSERSRLEETTKDSKLCVQPPNWASKMPNLPLYLYRKVAPFRLKSNVQAKVGSRLRFPSCGAAPEALPVCSGAEWGRTWLSSGVQHDEWSSGWTWMQGPLGVGSGWSGVGIVQRPLITSGAGEVGLWCLHVLSDESVFLSLPKKRALFTNVKLSDCGNLVQNRPLSDTTCWYSNHAHALQIRKP